MLNLTLSTYKVCVHAKSPQSCLTLCNPMDSSLAGSLSMGFSGKNTGVSCHALLERISPTQELNLHFLCLLHWKAGFFVCLFCFLLLVLSVKPIHKAVVIIYILVIHRSGSELKLLD